MTNESDKICNSENDTTKAVACGFQTPTRRVQPSVVTPPETPSKHLGSCRKRQRVVDPREDGSLFLPELSDLDSPVRCLRPRSSSTFQINKRLCRIPSKQFPMIPSNFEEEEDDSPVFIKLAPRFQRERIMDLASDLSSNKRLRITPAQQTCIPFPIDL